jgi:transcriptional accessory protein Tex/SPT6
MVDETRRENLLSIEDLVKERIYKIIHQFRCDYMDIPYIAKYRKFEWSKELIEEDVWNILNLDLEYGKF